MSDEAGGHDAGYDGLGHDGLGHDVDPQYGQEVMPVSEELRPMSGISLGALGEQPQRHLARSAA
jgi:hypothetical protein